MPNKKQRPAVKTDIDEDSMRLLQHNICLITDNPNLTEGVIAIHVSNVDQKGISLGYAGKVTAQKVLDILDSCRYALWKQLESGNEDNNL